MKKRRGKRLVAYIIAFAMIFSMGMTELSPIAEAAQYTILETDVSAPSTGCTMFGVYGTYYVDAQNALNRINEIRKEACEAGNVPDPRNSNRMLTASDYVPIKWSTDLERIARIRAVKLCSTFMIQIRLSSRFLYHIQNTKKFKVAAFEKQIKKVQFSRCRSLL